MDRVTKTRIENYAYDITVGTGECDPERAPSSPDVSAYRDLEKFLGHELLEEEKRYFQNCYKEQLLSLACP